MKESNEEKLNIQEKTLRLPLFVHWETLIFKNKNKNKSPNSF